MVQANGSPDLRGLAPGSRVQASLLVTGVDRRSYGNGKGCVILTLANVSGHIASAPFWNGPQSAAAGVCQGDVVAVLGEVGAYRGRRQLEIVSLQVLPPSEIDWAALLPSAGDPAPFWSRLDGWRAGIRGPRLRRVVALFYDDEEFRRRYGACPGSTAGHHAEVGGLLRHTCEVASIGFAIAAGRGGDPDLVLAGALLHDIGKLEAYTWSGSFETTPAGALLGHVALGMLMLHRRVAAERPAPCTERELLIIQHLIASHHGRLEFGATAPPMTLEAEILHYADDASAKSASMAAALGDPDLFVGDAPVSARGVWHLDRRKVYRGVSDWGREAG